MNKLQLVCSLTLAATTMMSAPRPALAAGAMSDAKMVDCKSAAMVMAPHGAMTGSHDSMSAPHDAMKPEGLDQQFLHSMMEHNAMAMKMAHVEAQCGKDEKTRKLAQALADEMQRAQDEIRLQLQRSP